LISNPEPNDCKYLKKVTMPDELKEANDLKMTAVKGGLMISSDLGQLQYFNTTALIQNRQGE
jgi:hypothetical protein